MECNQNDEKSAPEKQRSKLPLQLLLIISIIVVSLAGYITLKEFGADLFTPERHPCDDHLRHYGAMELAYQYPPAHIYPTIADYFGLETQPDQSHLNRYSVVIRGSIPDFDSILDRGNVGLDDPWLIMFRPAGENWYLNDVFALRDDRVLRLYNPDKGSRYNKDKLYKCIGTWDPIN